MSRGWSRCEPYVYSDGDRVLARVERIGPMWMVRFSTGNRLDAYAGLTDTLREAKDLAKRELAASEATERRRRGMPEPENRVEVGLLHVPENRETGR